MGKNNLRECYYLLSGEDSLCKTTYLGITHELLDLCDDIEKSIEDLIFDGYGRDIEILSDIIVDKYRKGNPIVSIKEFKSICELFSSLNINFCPAWSNLEKSIFIYIIHNINKQCGRYSVN